MVDLDTFDLYNVKRISGFVRETLDLIGKVDHEGWAVLVAEKSSDEATTRFVSLM